ncbi:hypothetical protein [Ventosimonas gracilis]|nr:hypothetical protein [Ventosimonas gracilis]
MQQDFKDNAMKAEVTSIGKESYQIIASNQRSGRVTKSIVSRAEAIEVLASHYLCCVAHRCIRSRITSLRLKDARDLLETIGAKRVATNVYELPFELTKEEKALLRAKKVELIRFFRGCNPYSKTRAAA